MFLESFNIGSRFIGNSYPCFLVAEVGQAHDGSVGIAHSYIDAISKSGADAVKFQMHFAEEESTKLDEFRIKFSYVDKTRYDYWKRMEFTFEQWKELKDHCESKGLIFLCSPFSVKSVIVLHELGVLAWKIASGEFSNKLLLDEITNYSNYPLLMSTGISTYLQINLVRQYLEKKENPILFFQCSSMYPMKLKDVGLNMISEYKRDLGIPVGLSDHTGSINPSLAAISLGADMVELHVVFHKSMFGPDTSSSVTLDEFKRLTEFRDDFFELKSNPVRKTSLSEDLKKNQMLFSKSLVVNRDIKKGEIITKDKLTAKKPGVGILVNNVDNVVNKRVNKDLKKNHILTYDDLN